MRITLERRLGLLRGLTGGVAGNAAKCGEDTESTLHCDDVAD
jgi:hypothetical protein